MNQRRTKGDVWSTENQLSPILVISLVVFPGGTPKANTCIKIEKW